MGDKNEVIPEFYEDVLQKSDAREWKKDLEFEFDLLQKLNTWDSVEMPSDRKVIKTKWVFYLNRDGNAKIIKQSEACAQWILADT